MNNSLKGKRVLVTGGCGFIGSHIVDKLVELGSNVIILDDLSTGNLDNIKHHRNKVEFVKGDIRDEALLDKILNGVELISHQAALRSVPKSVGRPFDYHDVNVRGTLNLYLKAKERGIKRIVYASSSSVYGERFDFPEKETDSPKPLSPYAATKLFGEYYGYIFTKLYGLEVVCLRYFNVFGPRQSLENKYALVVPKFITSLLNDENPSIYGDGNQERDFVYIEDVVEANILALTKEGIEGEVFNIASSKPQSVNNLLKILQEITAKDIDPVYLDPRPGDVRKTQGDIDRAKKLLGWHAKTDFRQGLKKTVEWFSDSKI
ncbi:MAG: SDR family oxidoreductase [Candidatus Omnitrophica bacterium]|nr:SDR family oxidoreductase [Candidatus Omnitrophota bacterium]